MVQRPCCDERPIGTLETMTEPSLANSTHADGRNRLRVNSPVVVGIDGSHEARRGLLFAADLAERIGVKLVAVHAYGLVGSCGDWRDGVEERQRQVDAAMVETWCSPLATPRDLSWQSLCVHGNAVEGVLRTADDVDAGLIVVGSHGAGNSSSGFLGSTSHDLLRHSHRPVVVVPPPEDHRHRRVGVGATDDPIGDS